MTNLSSILFFVSYDSVISHGIVNRRELRLEEKILKILAVLLFAAVEQCVLYQPTAPFQKELLRSS